MNCNISIDFHQDEWIVSGNDGGGGEAFIIRICEGERGDENLGSGRLNDWPSTNQVIGREDDDDDDHVQWGSEDFIEPTPCRRTMRQPSESQ